VIVPIKRITFKSITGHPGGKLGPCGALLAHSQTHLVQTQSALFSCRLLKFPKIIIRSVSIFFSTKLSEVWEMKKGTLFIVISILLTNFQVQSADASTSITKAKSMIRSLYYGQQQASQRSLAAENSYILSHNYPGMYSTAKQCLTDLENQFGQGYGPAVPNLLTVDFDTEWRVPTGLPSNRLSGKKPKGETFVVDVNWNSGLATNHVTILNGKAYYFLWICGS